MTDLKKLADEYAAHGKVAGTEAIRRRAYLAGARAALEMAACQIIDDGNPALARQRIRSLLPEVSP